MRPMFTPIITPRTVWCFRFEKWPKRITLPSPSHGLGYAPRGKGEFSILPQATITVSGNSQRFTP